MVIFLSRFYYVILKYAFSYWHAFEVHTCISCISCDVLEIEIFMSSVSGETNNTATFRNIFGTDALSLVKVSSTDLWVLQPNLFQ